MTLTVLNGTETEGLAHRTADELQRDGYSQATPLGGRPSGADQATVVEYAPGQRERRRRSGPGALARAPCSRSKNRSPRSPTRPRSL